MNTHAPIDEPLQPDERDLARIVRALPAGEPPPGLDARILKAASDAVAASARRRRFAWLGSGGALWSIGSAAAAVLAIGIAWKTTTPPNRSLPTSAPVPVAADAPETDGVAVEFKEEAARSDAAAPPPAATRVGADARAQRRAVPAVPAVPEAPTAFPDSGLDEHVSGTAAAAPPPAPATAPPPPLAQAAEAMAAPVAGTAANRDRGEDQALAKSMQDLGAMETEAGRTLQRQNEAEAERRVQSDTQRYPESWLLKIRARWREGDVEGARASLRLFVAKYPDHGLPEDLRPLLQE